ncbi:alpha/beta hydrolase fold domain-containing protein [Pseudoduganella sp. LjRoot289]|uniref:alpha/beta hydrolase family esterase n=1 Tax=Pseudoduganella sp. LjRoot289 TaxID=3342314 RepID=UPI003ED02266
MAITALLKRALALATLAGTVFPAGAASITAGTLARPEGPRQYLLAQSDKAGKGGKPALVILLHGHGASAQMSFGRGKINDPAAAWLDVADRENLLVIAPDGWKGSDGKQGWNDCRADAPTNPKTDDTGLLEALIDKAVADFNADPERVYVTGSSNGGGMAYRAAIELRPRIAAVAVLSALMPRQSACAAPQAALPVMAIHGTGDKIAPYAGGQVGHWLMKGRGSGLGAEESVKLWRELAGLADAPRIDKVPHLDKSDPTSVTRYTWGADPARMQFELLKIDQGGHVPPSISRRLSWLVVKLLGEQNGDIEFADEAWNFFKDKRRDTPANVR